jgi:hypothetical protein
MNESHSLASTLEPVLRDACAGHLSAVRWFHAQWQHGGAGTGFAEWKTQRGKVIPCVVKLPVSYNEYAWTKRLGLVGEPDWVRSEPMTLPTPRVLAGGFELGAYDFAWLVMERFPGNPVGVHEMSGSDVWELFEVTAEFHAAALLERPLDTAPPPPQDDWQAMLTRAIAKVREGIIEDADRWESALERVSGCLDDLVDRWRARPIDTWCHGDVHPHNAMRREIARDALDGAPLVETALEQSRGKLALIDLANIRPGCWIEDALYLERLCWGREEVLAGVDPVGTLARTRRGLGLPTEESDLAIADLRRVLMAATSPAFSRTQGDPIYLSTALKRLEGLLPAVCG